MLWGGGRELGGEWYGNSGFIWGSKNIVKQGLVLALL